MTKTKQRLELTWIGKEKRPRLEPRILLEDTALSHHAPFRRTDHDIYDNKLIYGDNLLALKTLEQDYANRVKCIFIDPPYNTGSAFEHYDDGLEHSIWLGLMRDRLEMLKRLLCDDGSIWITIDDHEAHYLKVVCDEVFGRRNFIANVIWQKKYSIANDHKTIAPTHDHVLVYSKTSPWQRNLLPRTDENDKQYRYKDEKGVFRPDNYTCNKTYEERPNLYYSITQPITQEEIWPSKTRVWSYSKEEHLKHVKEGLIYWGKDGKGKVPSYKRYKHMLRNQGTVPQTIWLHDFAGHTDASRKEVRAVLDSSSLVDDFLTPKPEKLLQRVLEIATNPGDLVLDSFAGSGTTGAVAQKMGRRWIMIELGEHARTHIVPRLKKVINGEDQGGISKAVGWIGGGGFRYYNLAPSLLLQDAHGFPIINPDYNPVMLAEAMCKLMGFHYAPSDTVYWQHGQSTESAYIYVTTRLLDKATLALISADVGPERSLIICCPGWRGQADQFDNLVLHKIPKAVLSRCEWGHDDYSLNIKNLPLLKPEPETPAKVKKSVGMPLFGD